MSERNWREVVEKAEHYLAIDYTEVLLWREADDFPWEFVTSGELGGTHRWEITTSYGFVAKHPCGITFRWSFDIEPYSANGSGSYQIDVDGVLRVLKALPDEPRTAFRRYLADCAEKVAAKAREWQATADRQAVDAKTLLFLSRKLSPSLDESLQVAKP